MTRQCHGNHNIRRRTIIPIQRNILRCDSNGLIDVLYLLGNSPILIQVRLPQPLTQILEIKQAVAPPARLVRGIKFRSIVYLLFKFRNPKNSENTCPSIANPKCHRKIQLLLYKYREGLPFWAQSQVPAKNPSTYTWIKFEGQIQIYYNRSKVLGF